MPSGRRCFLAAPSDYTRALRSRHYVHSECWRLHAARGSGAPRFAVVVAKRHVRKAAHRNRIRRVLREYFRQTLRHQLPPRDYLLRTLAPLPPRASGAELRAQCRQLFIQAGCKV